MDYAEIRRCSVNCRFTDHARKEMEAERLGRIRVEEVLQALDTGGIIEEYVDDTPYPISQTPIDGSQIFGGGSGDEVCNLQAR